MDKSFTLHIPSPCEQPWDKMSKTANGKFCSHCSAEVIDFTKMTTAQVQAYFQTTTQKVCGRIDPFQLQQLNNPVTLHPSKGRFSLKIAMASAITLLVTAKASAQQVVEKTKLPVHVTSTKANSNGQHHEDTGESTFTIKGMVKAKDDGLALAGATVKVIGLNQSTSADPNGMFKLQVKGAAKQQVTLRIVHLGYESQEVKIVLGQQQISLAINLVQESFLLGEVMVVPFTAKQQKLQIDTLKTVALQSTLVGGICVRKVRPSIFRRAINHVSSWFK